MKIINYSIVQALYKELSDTKRISENKILEVFSDSYAHPPVSTLPQLHEKMHVSYWLNDYLKYRQGVTKELSTKIHDTIKDLVFDDILQIFLDSSPAKDKERLFRQLTLADVSTPAEHPDVYRKIILTTHAFFTEAPNRTLLHNRLSTLFRNAVLQETSVV